VETDIGVSAEQGVLEEVLARHALELVQQLESGEAKGAMESISRLYKERERGLYYEVGRLTRSLHDSILNFEIDAGIADIPKHPEDPSRMEDASERLKYVLSMTENRANRTMDMVEETLPISERLGSSATSLREGWKRLMRREMSPAEFRVLYQEIDQFLELTETETGRVAHNLSTILLAQDFQDITGQVIKRVIDLVVEVESSLVELVKMASKVDTISGTRYKPSEKVLRDKHGVGAEGPIIHPEKRVDVCHGQDEVDDLLSSLGF
jgi:chemotaxis protein CheZ